VEPPDIKAYGLAMALHTEDAMRYTAYKIEHPEQKPQGTERGMEAAMRPGNQPNKQYDEKDHQWHDKTGKVVEPPADVKAYGVFAAAHTEDVFNYTAWKLTHPEKSLAANPDRNLSDGNSDSSTQWSWQSTDT
jgi:hypothetical protein